MENGRREEDGYGYDRAKEVKEFDDSKMGVKGLVDSGITSIPRFFIHPPDSLPCTTISAAPPPPHASNPIPIIDLSGFDSDRRSIIVDQIRDASRTLGFFQVIHHGIPSEVLDRTISAIKAFHEQPTEIKALHYNRDIGRSVSFVSNFDLYKSKAASWRDTIMVRWGPNIDITEIPEICRSELVEWRRQVQGLGETLMEILSEGLGVEGGRLKALSCTEAMTMVAHYYPFCPQPDLTFGITSHTDARVLTVLLQDHIRGLQIISNEEYRAVEHRVLANQLREPRISIASFFNPSKREDFYGPLSELISADKPALYRPFTLSEFLARFYTKESSDKALVNYFQL